MANQVLLSVDYIPNPTIGKALSLANIYVGIVDLDPKIVGNQKQISVLQENGTTVEVGQPISTSAGGAPLYNGSPVTILVDGSYSLRIDDSTGAQVYYVPQNVGVAAFNSIDSIADLRAITENPLNGQETTLLGYYTPSDGGGGPFYWDSSDLSAEVAADTVGMIYIALDSEPTGATGAWVRMYTLPVIPQQAGAKFDDLTDNTTAAQYCADNFEWIEITDGICKTDKVTIPNTLRKLSGTGTIKRFTTTDGTNSHIWLASAQDLVIEGITIDGDFTPTTYPGPTQEFGHNIDVRGGKNITIRDCKLLSPRGDNVQIAAVDVNNQGDNIKIYNNEMLESYRNSLSIVAGSNIEAYGNTMDKTPAGYRVIDIEPFDTGYVLEMHNINVHDNIINSLLTDVFDINIGVVGTSVKDIKFDYNTLTTNQIPIQWHSSIPIDGVSYFKNKLYTSGQTGTKNRLIEALPTGLRSKNVTIARNSVDDCHLTAGSSLITVGNIDGGMVEKNNITSTNGVNGPALIEASGDLVFQKNVFNLGVLGGGAIGLIVQGKSGDESINTQVLSNALNYSGVNTVKLNGFTQNTLFKNNKNSEGVFAINKVGVNTFVTESNNGNIAQEVRVYASAVFDGTPGTPTLTNSFNVSGITKTGTGDFTVSFTSNLPSINYMVVGSSVGDSTGVRSVVGASGVANFAYQCRVIFVNSAGTPVDSDNFQIMFFH